MLDDSGGLCNQEILLLADRRTPTNDMWLEGSTWSDELVNAFNNARRVLGAFETTTLASESRAIMDKFETFKPTEVNLI